MNTKQTNNHSLWLLAILLLTSTAIGWAAKPESIKKKEINRSFQVSLSDLLLTDNRYGNTTITHWNKNEVAIRVEIESKAESEKEAQATLDRIQVDIEKNGNTVSAVTSLKQQKGNWGRNERFTINYFINIPSKLAINLTQKYGNITLPDKNEGKSDIHVKYGNLKAGSFTEALLLEAKYGNVDIDNVTKAELNLGYCGNASVGNAGLLYAENKYSNMEIKNCKQLTLENKYGNVKIKHLDKGDIEIKYSEATIDYLKESLVIGELAYSTLNIQELSPTFKTLNADARYGNLNVNIQSNASFKVAAENMKYGNLNVKGFNITKSSTEDKVNHYYEINGGNKGRIYFDGNNYSNLRIKTL